MFNFGESLHKALLTIVAVLLISNTIRITIMSRATEIQIMRLVGAKNSYIRRPYLMEGAWIGALLPSFLLGSFIFWVSHGLLIS